MTTTIIVASVAVVVALLIAVPVTCKVAVNNKIQKDAEVVGTAEDKARSIIDEALKTAETKKREALLEVKEESLRTKNELEKETKERRNELQKNIPICSNNPGMINRNSRLCQSNRLIQSLSAAENFQLRRMLSLTAYNNVVHRIYIIHI